MAGSTDPWTAVFAVAVGVAVFATVCSLGMSMTVGEVTASFRHPLLLGGMVVLNALCIPALAWGITSWMGLPDDAATGIALAAVGAAGAAGLKAAQLSRVADLALAVALVIVLQVVNLVSVPLWAAVFVDDATTSRGRTVVELLVLVLTPLILGLAVRRSSPVRADRWRARSIRLANVALVVAIGVGCIANRDELVALVGTAVLPASLLIVACSLGAGWVLGGVRDPRRSAATALVSGMRFAALGLVVVSSQLGGRPSVLGPAVLYSLVDLIVAVGVGVAVGRWHERSMSAPARGSI